MINQVASTVSLAKMVRGALDFSKEHSQLPTRTLELLCNTLIELGEGGNATAQAVQTAHHNMVQSRIAGVEGR